MAASTLLRDIPRRLWGPVLDAARLVFPPRNRFGVNAYAIGPCIREGRRMAALALNVYVVRKLHEPRLKVPTLSIEVGRKTWHITPNVIATGKRPRAVAGGSPRFSGLHPGAAIAVRGLTPGHGAIACLLGKRSGPTHALTAGHIFPRGALGERVFAAASPSASPRSVGKVVANFLDHQGVDAALIELNAVGIDLVSQQGPRLSDFASEISCFDKLVRSFLATTNDFSREVVTERAPMDAHLLAPTRGVFLVKNVIPTDGEVTNAGDSGTVLCSGASNDLALGVCSGGLGHHSVFEPMERVLQLVNRIDRQLIIV
jgi:hypothetical protein